MYFAPVFALAFAAHVRACVSPAACEDETNPERKPDSDTAWIALDSLIENHSQLCKQTMVSLRQFLVENDSQTAAFDFECGYLVTPALMAMGGQNGLKTRFVDTSTPRTKYPMGENL